MRLPIPHNRLSYLFTLQFITPSQIQTNSAPHPSLSSPSFHTSKSITRPERRELRAGGYQLALVDGDLTRCLVSYITEDNGVRCTTAGLV